MRTLKISLLVFTLSITISAQWYQQNSGTTTDLKDVCFVDDNNGWIVGINGTILRTTDGGSTWFQQISGTIQNLYSVDFVDVNYGWAVGANNTILHTISGGTNWIAQTIPADTIYYSVCFLDQNLGWAAGRRGNDASGYVCKTTNGGTDWTDLGNIGPYHCSAVFFVNEDIGRLIRPNSGYILKSFNGGLNWMEELVHPFPNDVFFLNENIGWVSGSNSVISNTTNGGIIWWLQMVSSTNHSLYSLYFVDENKGWVAGSDGFIGFTSDGGYIWFDQSFGSTNTIWSIYFIDQHTGWAVGESGIIVFTENGGISSVEESSINPLKFLLSQNYPNPFNPVTKIKYSIPYVETRHASSLQMVTLKIYDLLGREVATLVNEVKPAGEYEVEFNAANLPSGIYFYRLQAGDFIQTKKMILLK